MAEKNLGAGRGSSHYAYAIVASCVAMTLPVAGKLMGRLDLRALLSACVALCAAGCAGMGLSCEMWQFYVCGALMGVGLAPLLYLAVPTLINAWFARRVGFFVGLCMAFTGIGGVIFNPVGTALIASGPEGWRTAYLAFAAIILVGTLPFTALVVRGEPQDKGLVPFGAGGVVPTGDGGPTVAGAAGGPGTGGGLTLAEALRTPAFLAVMAFSGLITLNQNIYQFLPSYATSFADSLPAVAAASGVVASACMGGQAVGKVLLGIINDRSVRAGICLGVGSGVVGLTLMWLVPGELALLLAGAFLFGIAYAMTTVQTPLLTRTVFGGADYTNIYSKITMVGALMGTVSAVAWSFVVDSAGGYPLMFVLGYVLLLGCGALALFSLAWRRAHGGAA